MKKLHLFDKSNINRTSLFSRKSIDPNKFIREIYVENGLAYISCNVEGYYDVIDSYSVSGYEWLNQSFTRFIEENAITIPVTYPIVLEICGYSFTEEEKDIIEGTVADYYALKMADVQEKYNKGKKRTFFQLIMSIIMAGLLYISSANRELFPALVNETIVILFWLLIGDLFESFLFTRSEIIDLRTKAAQLASMVITFKKTFDDKPLKPSEEKVIIEEVLEENELIPSDEWDD